MALDRLKRRPSPADVADEVLRGKSQGRSLPVDIEAILAGEVVELEYFEGEREVEGRLELVENRPTIFVNVRGRGPRHPRVRFTLAHEAGHYFLHRHRLRTHGPFRDDRITLEQGGKADDPEREANEFAIEVLLPRGLVRERFARRPLIDITFIAKLADEANVSLQATAIRVAKETSDRICVLLLEGGLIEWVVVSDDWREARLPAGQLKGRPIPPGAVAARLGGDYREQRVPLVAWAPNQAWRDGDLYESALATPYGRIVFLGAEGSGDQEEDDCSNDEDE